MKTKKELKNASLWLAPYLKFTKINNSKGNQIYIGVSKNPRFVSCNFYISKDPFNIVNDDKCPKTKKK